MTNNYILSLCLFSTLSYCFASSIESSRTHQRDLHITLDLLGQELFVPNSAASAMQLCNGLTAEAAPILTTLASWKTLIRYSTEAEFSQTNSWDIYYHKKAFLLFIPKIYKQKLHAQTAEDLGFDLEEWQELVDLEKLYRPSFFQTCKDYISWSLNNDIIYRNGLLPLYSSQFVDLVKKLLISKTVRDFKWNILLCGHGGTSPISVSIIGGLYPNYFKQFLTVLNEHISTRVLVYLTCGGGSNEFLNKLYKTNNIRNVYNFTLVCPCLTAIPSFTTQQPEFKSFFDHIHEAPIEQNNAEKLMQAVSCCVPIGEFTVTVKDKPITRTLFNNMPHICWANTDKFEIGHVEGKIEPLSYIIEKAGKNKQTQNNIKKESGDIITDAQTLIIDRAYIPYRLVLPRGNTHFVASSLENQTCYIHSLKIENLKTEGDLLKLCKKSLKKRSNPQVFLIDTVEYTVGKQAHKLESVIIFLHALTPETYRYQRVNKLFYSKNNKAYTINLKHGKQTLKELSPYMAKKYFMFFEQEKAHVKACMRALV